MDKKQLLQMYRDISEVNKTELTADINKALAEGTFNFASDLDKDRFFAVLESLINLRNAAGYEMFSNRVK